MKAKARILKRSTLNAQRSTRQRHYVECASKGIETSGLDTKPLGEAAFFLMLLAGAYFDVSN
jgi:hypothetical protein